MGIDVDPLGRVSFNPSHEHRVVTDSARPALTWTHGALPVLAIFRRVQTHDTQDGNPLIFALKGLKGFTIDTTSAKSLVAAAKTICARELAGASFDYVVPMPSSAKLSRQLAKRIAKLTKAEVISPLRKITVGEALLQMPPIDTVPRRLRRDLGSLLKALAGSSSSNLLQMKLVDKRLRSYISPIQPAPKAKSLAGARVLLVDDLFASGASLVAAESSVRHLGAASVSAITLLGKL